VLLIIFFFKHHRRLFIIDRQVEHILEVKHAGMGKWLRDRVHRANERLEEALATVEKHPHGLDVEGLLAQFKEQREFQTKTVDREFVISIYDLS
jgi:hypothetical protein